MLWENLKRSKMEDKMNYKLSLRAFSIIYILLGLMFIILSPESVLKCFGVDSLPVPDTANNDSMNIWRLVGFMRVFGAAIIMVGVVFGFLAYLEGDKNQRLAAMGITIGSFLLFLIMITQQIAFWETIYGWYFLTVFIITMIYFAVMSFSKITGKTLTI